jgi:hypothetical protein
MVDRASLNLMLHLMLRPATLVLGFVAAVTSWHAKVRVGLYCLRRHRKTEVGAKRQDRADAGRNFIYAQVRCEPGGAGLLPPEMN